jgi:hypothetical protein
MSCFIDHERPLANWAMSVQMFDDFRIPKDTSITEVVVGVTLW